MNNVTEKFYDQILPTLKILILFSNLIFPQQIAEK